MEISNDTSDSAVLAELGRRIARYRLNKNLTQDALANHAGVSTPTVQRIERGKSTQATNLIRILRALGLLGTLEALIQEPAISPIQQVKLRGKQRKRASSRVGKHEPRPAWTWSDDE